MAEVFDLYVYAYNELQALKTDLVAMYTSLDGRMKPATKKTDAAMRLLAAKVVEVGADIDEMEATFHKGLQTLITSRAAGRQSV